MISIDYKYSSVKINDLSKYYSQIKLIVDKFNQKTCLGNDFIGWYDYVFEINPQLIDLLDKEAKTIRKMSDVFVVCGIGGSYLGARAVIEAIKGFNGSNIEVIYMGNTFDERYTVDVLNYLKDKNYCVNVISKSGSTLETSYAFRLLKDQLYQKYGEEANKRIYVTTDPNKGVLRKMANEYGYKTFDIPSNIGGRYSVFTPVGLLPMMVAGVDCQAFVEGAKVALEDFKCEKFEKNLAYQYAAYRYDKYKNGKQIELFATYSPYLNMISEWWKQLFGESEGKEGKGLFPASVNFSTDLHSLGQFVQQGKKNLFLTQFKIAGCGNLKIPVLENDMDDLNYLNGLSLNDINIAAQSGTNKAHFFDGEVDNFTFEMDCVNEFNIGYVLFMFMCSCMVSANLLGVNPFDQPGVEFYKNEMKKILKKRIKKLKKTVD